MQLAKHTMLTQHVALSFPFETKVENINIFNGFDVSRILGMIYLTELK